MATAELFDLSGRVAVVTGGGGRLGREHAEAIATGGGIPVLADIAEEAAERVAAGIRDEYGVDAWASRVDVSSEVDVTRLCEEILQRHGRVDILVNNAAVDPKVEPGGLETPRLEVYPLERWNEELAVGLTGAFLCSRVLGAEMARRGKGVIVNIASDLGVVAPDQRLYRKEGVPDDEQPVKPASYSAVKAGLIGLTRYLATYWADRGVRANALSPGGVYDRQPDEFVRRFSALAPLGRMARADEYRGAILFLCSDASSYMTGQNLIVDGGRTAW
jgi:NAD(P)-dependent dehydrogenase (short-subunit alcohol dehydrogenase family)